MGHRGRHRTRRGATAGGGPVHKILTDTCYSTGLYDRLTKTKPSAINGMESRRSASVPPSEEANVPPMAWVGRSETGG
jgi:hypothetical protein